jgi:DNA excision repair protein ERCC-8
MLTTDLLSRALGDTALHSFYQTQTTRLVKALQPAPRIRFEGVWKQSAARSKQVGEDEASDGEEAHVPDAIAHPSGVNTITVDKFEGR